MPRPHTEHYDLTDAEKRYLTSARCSTASKSPAIPSA